MAVKRDDAAAAALRHRLLLAGMMLGAPGIHVHHMMLEAHEAGRLSIPAQQKGPTVPFN